MKINVKKIGKITGIAVVLAIVAWDVFSKGREYLEKYKTNLRQEGYVYALKLIGQYVDKDKKVELSIPNADGSVKKLNLVLENKR